MSILSFLFYACAIWVFFSIFFSAFFIFGLFRISGKMNLEDSLERDPEFKNNEEQNQITPKIEIQTKEIQLKEVQAKEQEYIIEIQEWRGKSQINELSLFIERNQSMDIHTLEEFEHFFLNPEALTKRFSLVALLNNKIVGALVYSISGEHCTIHYLTVARWHRKQGVGTLLVTEVSRILSNKSVKTISIDLMNENNVAVNFLSNLLFKRVSTFSKDGAFVHDRKFEKSI